MATSTKAPRRIGLLGGMSWQSTAIYYRLINQGVADALGGLHSAEILMDSVDLGPLAELQHAGDWPAIGSELTKRAVALEQAGAEAMVVATNTMHLVADDIEEQLDIPLIHVVDEVAEVAMHRGWRTLGLLGTDFTMTSPLYPDRLAGLGLAVVTPSAEDRAQVHRVIYDELCNGILSGTSQAAYLEIVDRLAEAGAEAVVLGCTEVGMLLTPDCGASLPLIDSAEVHAAAAVAFALGKH